MTWSQNKLIIVGIIIVCKVFISRFVLTEFEWVSLSFRWLLELFKRKTLFYCHKYFTHYSSFIWRQWTGSATDSWSDKVPYNDWIDGNGCTWGRFCGTLQRTCAKDITFGTWWCYHVACVWIFLWIFATSICLRNSKWRLNDYRTGNFVMSLWPVFLIIE